MQVEMPIGLLDFLEQRQQVVSQVVHRTTSLNLVQDEMESILLKFSIQELESELRQQAQRQHLMSMVRFVSEHEQEMDSISFQILLV